MRNKKFSEAIVKCFIEVYENAIPKADFAELLENAVIDQNGQRKINFEDYLIDDEIFKDIVEKHIKLSKIPKYLRQSFRFSLYLGPSPVSIKNEKI